MNALIIGRVWAGVGGAGMYLGYSDFERFCGPTMLTKYNSVLNLISINTSMQERPIYVAISGIVWGAGSILGPVIGGSFADSSATWRWVSIPAMFSSKSCYSKLLTSCRPSIST